MRKACWLSFAPGLILLFVLLGAPDVFAQLPQSSAEKTVISSKLQPFVDNHSLAGAVVLVANKDRVLTLETVGYADVGNTTPMQPDSLFWIASMSKPITGLAFMLLVDEGKVSLDDSVEKFLPEFRGMWLTGERDDNHLLLKRPARAITVRDILSHTSGLPFKSPIEEPTLDGLPLRVAVRSYATVPLEFEPGTKYQYSNAGINIAGRIIEVISGKAYEDFLHEKLFQPLEMPDTTFFPTESQVKRLAKAYRPDSEKKGLEETRISQLIYPLSGSNRYPMPAGGLFSTATDLSHLCQMVLNGGEFRGKRYLSEHAVKTMTSRQTGEAIKEGYGVGWSTNGVNFGHGGALATNMNIDSGRGLITIYLVQHAGFPGNGNQAQGVFRQTAEQLFAR